jgi:hypothetical protein
VAQLIQAKRDDRRHCGGPSRTNLGQAVALRDKKARAKHLRQFTDIELRAAIEKTRPRTAHQQPPFALKASRPKALATTVR